MTTPEQPEQPEQPAVNESAAPAPEVGLTRAPERGPETFAANVERLVAEGKLTAAEAAELLEPQLVAPSTGQQAERTERRVRPSDVTLVKQAGSDAGASAGHDVPPDLRLEVAGYSLSVVHDPSLAQPRLTASRDGALELRAGSAGWSVERTDYSKVWGLKAVLSLPWTPRHVRAEVAGGNLSLPDIAEQARVEVSGGNITLGASGELKAEVSGGNMTAGSVAGALRLEVNGGNMTVAHSAALQAEVNGGHLTWTGLLSEGQHSVKVNGGQATLTLEAGSSVSVQAESTLGGVSSSFPLQKSGGMMHASYSGTLGSGEAILRCEVNAGQIRLVTT